MKCLISGGSSGLGRELALCLAGAGHGVTTFARRPVPPAAGITHLLLDAADTAAVERTLGPIVGDFDRLVNNIGTAESALLATQSLESIERMIAVNLTSVVQLTKLWLRERLRRGSSGAAVSVSSIVGERGFSGLSVYSATKGALDALTRSLAREMGPKGFRFNAVLPGYFDSAMSGEMAAEDKERIARRTPLGRLATTKDVIPVIEFLLSDGAAFMTGQLIVIDGGLTC